MHRKLLPVALCACLCIPRPLEAAFERTPSDPRGIAMSGALTALPGDAFGIFHNPAAPSLASRHEAAIAWSLPWNDSGRQTCSAGLTVAHPAFDRKGSVSAAFRSFGDGGYRESTLVAGYARALSSVVDAGFSISQMDLDADGAPDDSATAINAGITAGITPTVTIAGGAFNLNAPSIGGSELPETFVGGISCRLENGNRLSASVQGEADRSARLLAGGEFRATGRLLLRMGLSTNPSAVSGGAAYQAGAVRAEVAAGRHIDLGTTLSCGLSLGF